MREGLGVFTFHPPFQGRRSFEGFGSRFCNPDSSTDRCSSNNKIQDEAQIAKPAEKKAKGLTLTSRLPSDRESVVVILPLVPHRCNDDPVGPRDLEQGHVTSAAKGDDQLP